MDKEKIIDSPIFYNLSLEEGGGGRARFILLESLTVLTPFARPSLASFVKPPRSRQASTFSSVSGSQPGGQNLTSKNPPPCFENRFPTKIFAKFKTWPYAVSTVAPGPCTTALQPLGVSNDPWSTVPERFT